MKKCLNAKGHSGQLACGSDNPLAPFNNIFPPLKKFQQIPPKSHGPHLSALRKCIQSVRFASFVLPVGSSVKQNRRENAKRRGLKVSPFVKSSGRAFVAVAILLLSSHMNRTENRTLLQVPFCRDGGCGQGDFGGELAQLGVPCTDVRTGGEIV